MQDLVVIRIKGYLTKAGLVAVILIALACGWLAIRWQLGNMLATLTPAGDPNINHISQLAINWAPADPATYWLRASIDNDIAVHEQAVRRAPFDYRWRQELGRALEQDERFERAEAEFKKAAELAPTFAFPRWRLANFYLRRGRVDEAVEELKKAASNNQIYRDQAFSLVWDFFGKDASKVEELAGEGSEARARLAYFFAGRGRADDALRNWNLLSDEEKTVNPELLRGMAIGLYEQLYFPQSLEFARQAGFDPDAVPEKVTNDSFEKNLSEGPNSRFGWMVARGDPKFDVAVDQKVRREGTRSLRVTFRNFVKSELYNITQTVVVEPSSRYRLRFWVRTENLKSAGPPLLEIVNAHVGMPIARSQTFATGTNDWQEYTLDFNTPENCTAVNIRTTRAYCGEGCPIVGIFWYDGFELNRQ